MYIYINMSSGQPYRKPTDVRMYRNEYLTDLEMRKDLDKINLDANLNYIKTGALPPQSQMSDTRPPSDKILDLVYIKKQIIDALSPLSTPNYASNVVEAILSNANNVDNKLLVFTAQRLTEITEMLKKIYKIGIRGDYDDSRKLVNYIIKLFRTQNSAMTSLREMQNRFTTDKTTQSSILGTLHDIIFQIVVYIKYLIDKDPHTFRGLNRGIGDLYRVGRAIPNAKGDFIIVKKNEEYRLNVDKIKEKIRTGELGEAQPVLIRFLAFLNSDFPNISDLKYLFSRIVNSVEQWRAFKTQNKGIEDLDQYEREERKDEIRIIEDANQKNADKAIKAISDMYNIVCNEDVIERLKEFNQFLAYLSKSEIDKLSADEHKTMVNEYTTETGEVPDIYGIPPSIDSENISSYNQSSSSSSSSSMTSPPPPDDEPVPDLMPNALNSEELNRAIDDYKYIKKNLDKKATVKVLIENFNNRYGISIEDFERNYNAVIIASGNGLSKRGRGRPRGNGIIKSYKQTISENLNTDKGLEEARRFVKFGKYLINTNKLNDNILSLKIPSGGVVVGHPTIKITSNFKKIVKNMIDNVNPSFKDLQSLSDTEKNYLYTISKKANILDKFSIPTPDMSEDDKDINEYEILKGEIMAGNDNKDLIKKFKAKIIKMSNSGLLNKKEVSSILHDLLSLNL